MIARIKVAVRNLLVAFAVVMAAVWFVDQHVFYQLLVYAVYIAMFPLMGLGLWLMVKRAFRFR